MPGTIFWLFVGFLILLSSIFGKDGAMIALGLSASVLAVWLFKLESQKQKAIKEKHKYAIAKRILANEYWIGQTIEELRDSLGFPEKKETQETSSKIKETWKFFYNNSNRIRLKITIINGIVTQIEER